MNRVLCTLPLLLMLAACRDTETPSAANTTDAAATSATAAPAAGLPAAPAGQASTPAVDTGAMSGAFGTGTTRLELHGEGTYGLDEAGNVTSGTWTPIGTDRVHLDPGSKSARDRVYRREGNDALVLVDAGGEAAAGTRLNRLPMP